MCLVNEEARIDYKVGKLQGTVRKIITLLLVDSYLRTS